MTAPLIVAGDSQSAVRGSVVLSQTWGFNLARITGRPYVDAAVPGNTSTQIMGRLPAVLSGVAAGALVGVMAGANDPSSRLSPETTAVNFSAMAALARGAGATPFFVTPWAFWSTPQFALFPPYVSAIKAVGASLGITVVDAYQIQFDVAAAMGQTTMWPLAEADYQHPNAMGHYLILERVRAAGIA